VESPRKIPWTSAASSEEVKVGGVMDKKEGAGFGLPLVKGME
jgi:hypothetical protein